MAKEPQDTPDESAYEQSLKKLTDEQLATQAIELRAKIAAHMKEMAKRFEEQHRPTWGNKKK
jgi:hypothetical protein